MFHKARIESLESEVEWLTKEWGSLLNKIREQEVSCMKNYHILEHKIELLSKALGYKFYEEEPGVRITKAKQ